MDWKQIKAEYIAGGTSYRKLCEKYGVSRTTLQKKAKDEKWVDLRSQAEAKAETKIIETVSKKEAARLNKIINVTDKLLDKISTIIDMVDDTQGIKHISSALRDIKEIKGFKSDADMREQEARIKKLQKEAEGDTSEEKEVNVIFDGDIEEFSK